MVHPREHEPAAPRHAEIIHRLPIGQRLTWMVDCRLEIDERLVDQTRHCVNCGLRQIVGQVLALGERADAQRVAVGGEHRDALPHMFGGGAIHHDRRPRLELPGALARGDHERAAAEPGHSGLERGEGAQRGVEEDEPENLARERMRLRILLQPPAELEQRQHLVALEIREIDKTLHGGRSANASLSMSTCSSSRMNGGSSRSTCVSLAVPVRIPHSSSSAWICLAGRLVRNPVRKPAPWWPVTGPTMQLSRMYAATRLTCSSRFCDSIASMTASITAQAIGPPPNVVPRDSTWSAAETFAAVNNAAQGKPFPNALAAVSMSGMMP